VSAGNPFGENSYGLHPSGGSAVPTFAASIPPSPTKSNLNARENVVSYVTCWAERTPQGPAVKHGNHVLSYEQLEIKSREIATQLKLMGVGREVVVGICAERSIGLAAAALGVMRAGGAYMPLDPSHPLERLTYQLADAQAEIVIVVENENTSRHTKLANQVLRCSPNGGLDFPFQAECLLQPPAGEDLAYVIYTSGSTGHPKGVEITHANLENLICWYTSALELTGKDRVSQVASVGFDASVWELWPGLSAGACVCIADASTVSESRELQDWLLREQVTTSFIPTPMAEKLIALEWPGQTSLRVMMTGGDTLHGYPRVGLPFQLVNNYGPTECTVCSTSTVVPAGHASDRLPPIGRPVMNAEIYIIDEALQKVPDGTEGEILIGGRGVGRGYRNRPELTKEKFIPNPFDSDPLSRLYRTGDRGSFLPDGQIAFQGRVDNQIKIRGVRMEPGEIEAALNSHAALKESAVVAREFAPNDKRLVAYVVAESATSPSPSELRHFLSQKLPAPMIPSVFVRLERLPLNSSGKIDRSALPAPSRKNMTAREIGGAPRDALEKHLKEIWEKTFQLEHIGIREDFFELGGHSLLAGELMARVNEALKTNLPLSAVLEVRTIEDMAKILRERQDGGNWSSLVAVQPKGSRPPVFCIHSHTGDVLYCEYISQGAGSDQPIYGLQALGAVGRDPHRSIEEMAAHYVVELRTVKVHGPYHLFGFCFGGMVAFEMARQLNEQGERVGFLGVYNSPAPGTLKGWPLGQFTYLWRRTQDEWKKLLELNAGERLPHIKKNLRNFRLLVQRTAAIDGAETLSRIRRNGQGIELKDLESINIAAAKRYAPSYVFLGKITLFLAPDMARVYPVAPSEGWNKFTLEGLEVIMVPLDKKGWRGVPFVETVGGRIKEVLQSAASDP
jgi:amino acid adenylation domain-containing protein